MQKVVYLVIYPDKYELPVDYFDNLAKLAHHVGVSIPQMRLIIRKHIKVNNRYYELVC